MNKNASPHSIPAKIKTFPGSITICVNLSITRDFTFKPGFFSGSICLF